MFLHPYTGLAAPVASHTLLTPITLLHLTCSPSLSPSLIRPLSFRADAIALSRGGESVSRSRTKGSNNGGLNNTGDAYGGEGCRVKSLSPPCSFSIHVKFHARSGLFVERLDELGVKETRICLDHETGRGTRGRRRGEGSLVIGD